MDYKIIILAVIITIVLIVGTQVWKQRILKQLLKNMQQGDFDAYFKRLDTLSCKYFYPPFNREYMRLNGYIMKADKKKIEECFDLILGMRMNKKQELDVVIKAFYYYLDEDRDISVEVGDDELASSTNLDRDDLFLVWNRDDAIPRQLLEALAQGRPLTRSWNSPSRGWSVR